MLGVRIKQARTAAGLSLRDLAEISGNYVSAQVIQRYEQGITNPGSDVLIKLAKALNVKIEYFFRPISVQVSLNCPIYRKRATVPKKYLETIHAKVKDKVEKYLEIEELFPVDRFERITINNLRHKCVHKFNDIEKLADDLRSAWDLGNDPIENITDIVEDRGAMVISIEASDDFDGLSCWANDSIPVIVVKKGLPGDRQRSDLAHELGHLIMKVDDNINEEKAAKRFSAAFMAPAEAVYRELGRKRNNIDLSELVLLKRKYGMSMQQWIYRAKDLDIISDSKAIEWFKFFRKKQWYREEPIEVASEKPQRFNLLVIQAVTEKIISPIRAAEFLDIQYDEFRKDLTAELEKNHS